jgi:hypothetical protein
MLIPFTIIAKGGGWPAPVLRSGYCEPDTLLKQAGPGESVLPLESHHGRHLVAHDGKLVDKPVAAQRAQSATPEPAPMEVLIEALRAQGLDLSPETLAAARQRLVTKSST